ncbi:MAG: hypothetical protein M3M99_06345, partial [Actinomycetota bacterium]|nr:hypothetical protein [Actinomycetota bacterium]
VLAMPGDELESDPALACGLTRGLERGYSLLGGEPEAAMSALLGAVPSLDPSSQRDQLEALYRASAFSPGAGSPPTSMLSSKSLNGWLGWAQAHGVIGPGPEVSKQVADGFGLDLSARCLR